MGIALILLGLAAAGLVVDFAVENWSGAANDVTFSLFGGSFTATQVEVAIGENQFMLRMPNVLLMARLIEGTFPNYEQVVPRAHPHRVTLSRAGLTSALRRVSVLSEERTKPVKFLLSPGMLKLTANSPDYGEAEEQMEAQFAGEEIAIGFNSRYVLDALGAQSGEQVLIEMKDGLSPGVFKSFEEDGTLCVIMPMRI